MTGNHSRRAGRLGAGLGVVLVLAGATACGANPASGTPPETTPVAAPTVSASPATSAPAPASAAPTPGPGTPAPGPDGNPQRCATAELTGSLGAGEGAAGSVIRTLVLTNTGTRTCELTGFPGVSYVAGDDGHQVGPAASMSGPRGGPVSLAPGAAAAAELKMVNVANYDAGVCRPTPVRGLRVYPPGDTTSLFVATDGTGCAGTPPGDQLSVTSLRQP